MMIRYSMQLQLRMKEMLLQENPATSNINKVQDETKEVQNNSTEIQQKAPQIQNNKMTDEQIQASLNLIEQLSKKLESQTDRMDKDHQLIQKLLNEKQNTETTDDVKLLQNNQIESSLKDLDQQIQKQDNQLNQDQDKNQKKDSTDIENNDNLISDSQNKAQKPGAPKPAVPAANSNTFEVKNSDQKLVNGKLQFENAYNKKPIIVVNLEKAKLDILKDKLNKEKSAREALEKEKRLQQQRDAEKIIEKDPLDFFSKSPTLVPSLKYYGDRVSEPTVAVEKQSKQDQIYYNNIKAGAGGDNRRKRFQQLNPVSNIQFQKNQQN